MKDRFRMKLLDKMPKQQYEIREGMPNRPSFNWCGTKWQCCMEGGRLIHPGHPWQWYDANQVWYEGNELALHIENKHKVIEYWDGNTYQPVLAVGIIRSVQTFGYGIFSAEIKLPKGKNLWPSFWLVGEGPWPKSGEIDGSESWSGRYGNYFKISKPQPPYIIPLTYWNDTTNIHWEEDGQHKSVGSRRLPLIRSLKNPAEHFFKYEVEWRKDAIVFRVNGKNIRSYGYNIAKRLNDTKQHVIFNIWTTGEDYSLESPMLVKNFEYKPIS